MRFLMAVVGCLLSVQALAFQPPALPADRNSVRELRLGVVCYGGVSLAIYMYGMTRELHHLAMASAALECDAERSGATCGTVPPGEAWKTLPQSAQPYYTALVKRWTDEEVRTRVVVDVISGTSAGGINGILLAKALAHNRPLVGLRRIWFEEADIRKLATGRPWALRAAWRVARGKSALGGDAWLRQLYGALNQMDEPMPGPRLPSLIPPDQTIDLLVTATDFYGSQRLLEIGDPATSWEPRHDQVFRFSFARRANGETDSTAFSMKNNVALAFAARSSASFPVAFPAIRLDDLPKALGEPVNTAALASQLFADRLAGNKDPHAAARLAANLYLVDGGVLDNYPFSIAYRRVSRRTPVLETSRQFLYLEPDPRVGGVKPAADSEPPTSLQMFWNAKTSIPGAEPIAQDLLEIAQHNAKVVRIAEILRDDEKVARDEYQGRRGIDTSVAQQIELALKLELNTLGNPAMLARRLPKAVASERSVDRPEQAVPKGQSAGRRSALGELQRMREMVEADAAAGSPQAEEAYLRLRVHSVIDQLGRVMGTSLCALPDEYDGPETSLMRAVIFAWAEKEGLLGKNLDRERRADFLRAWDLGYLRRKLRFVSDWLNAQYDPKRYGEFDYGLSRVQIQESRLAIAGHVASITQVLRGNRLVELGLGDELRRAQSAMCVGVNPEVTPDTQAEALLRSPEAYGALDALGTELEKVLLEFQQSVLADLYGDFVTQTATWNHPEAARAVLARYLGFPYWDRVSYQFTAFSGVGDLTRLQIIRFSPNDTKTVSALGAGKLAGQGMAHFGAFFARDGREKDYLWGRLDGAERAMSLLYGRPQTRAELMPMLESILAEEAADEGVSEKNLSLLRNCLANPGSC